MAATSRVQGQIQDVADPVRPGTEDVDPGTLLYIEVKNASGGAVTITFDAIFKGVPAGNPATGQRRLYQFIWDGAAWVFSAGSADIAN